MKGIGFSNDIALQSLLLLNALNYEFRPKSQV